MITGSSHRLMTEFLLNEIGKIPTNENSIQDREAYKLSCGLALGMVNLTRGGKNNAGLADLRIEERLHRYILGGIDHSNDIANRSNSYGYHGDVQQNSCIAESHINTDITAAPAMLALGLMHFNTR